TAAPAAAPAVGKLVNESSSTASSDRSFRVPPFHHWLIGIYFTGLLVWLCRIFHASRRLNRLAREATELSQSQLRLAVRVAGDLGLRQPPLCRVSAQVSVPATWGMLRPVVLVPPSFESLPEQDQRSCLLHEMAHVAQRDGMWSWLAQLVVAAHWFHPAVHFAALQLRRRREDAADDTVLRTGISPASYSASLLRVADQLTRRGKAHPGMIGANINLEMRIRRVLNPNLQTFKPPRWVMMWTAAGFIALAATTIRLQTTLAQRPGPPSELTSQPDTATQPSQPNLASATSLYQRFRTVALNPNREAVTADTPLTSFQGRVTDPTGPMSDAVVLIRERLSTKNSHGQMTQPIVARAITDAAGHYRITKVPPPRRLHSSRFFWEVLAVDKNDRLDFREVLLGLPQPGGRNNTTVDIHLSDSDTISGTLVSSGGKPVANARVMIEILAIAENRPMSRRYRCEFRDDRIKPLFLSEEGGNFELPAFPNEIMEISIEHDDYLPQRVRTGLKEPPNQFTFWPARPGTLPYQVSPLKLQLQEAIEIQFEVLDEQGQPVEPLDVLVAKPPHKFYESIQLSDTGIWKTTAADLRAASSQEGNLPIWAKFDLESNLPPIHQAQNVDELIANKKIQLQAIKGVRLSGRVVAQPDGEPVPGAQILWSPTLAAKSKQSVFCQTDRQGNWVMVVPRTSGYVSVLGVVAGFDLVSYQTLTAAPVPHDRFTRQIEFDGQESITVPPFQVERIAPRLVRVVDITGKPLPNADVSANHVRLVRQDGKEYRLSEQLAPDVQTDANGECKLKLNQPQWSEGTVHVYFHEQDEPSGEITLTLDGQTPILPQSDTPIKIVAKQRWRITGKVIIDGQPSPGQEVSLAKRMVKSKRFGQLAGWGGKTDENGEFEIIASADQEYSVALVQRHPGQPKKYFFDQRPVREKVAPSHYRAAEISIESNQWKTMQQLHQELVDQGLQ
ncbi:MAG: hypothetical protein MI861_05630, partial [Pirellulales bacterium]|nr:hypothetical protein [Pirellulales bacterium]